LFNARKRLLDDQRLCQYGKAGKVHATVLGTFGDALYVAWVLFYVGLFFVRTFFFFGDATMCYSAWLQWKLAKEAVASASAHTFTHWGVKCGGEEGEAKAAL
jgi:hypothetical protein